MPDKTKFVFPLNIPKAHQVTSSAAIFVKDSVSICRIHGKIVKKDDKIDLEVRFSYK